MKKEEGREREGWNGEKCEASDGIGRYRLIAANYTSILFLLFSLVFFCLKKPLLHVCFLRDERTPDETFHFYFFTSTPFFIPPPPLFPSKVFLPRKTAISKSFRFSRETFALHSPLHHHFYRKFSPHFCCLWAQQLRYEGKNVERVHSSLMAVRVKTRWQLWGERYSKGEKKGGGRGEEEAEEEIVWYIIHPGAQSFVLAAFFIVYKFLFICDSLFFFD